MNLSNKKILVTGADGFIGSHLTEELVRHGAHVRAFVLYNSFNSWGWLDYSPEEIMKELDVFAGDVRDPHGVREAMRGCDIVFHLAALIGIPYSYHSPDTYVDTNIKGTLNVVQAARELGVVKVIHTSTSEVYGTAQFVPITVFPYKKENRIEDFVYTIREDGSRVRVLNPCIHDSSYWRDVGDLDAYWNANMDLTGVEPAFNVYGTKWPLRTFQAQYPPVKTVFKTKSAK